MLKHEIERDVADCWLGEEVEAAIKHNQYIYVATQPYGNLPRSLAEAAAVAILILLQFRECSCTGTL